MTMKKYIKKTMSNGKTKYDSTLKIFVLDSLRLDTISTQMAHSTGRRGYFLSHASWYNSAASGKTRAFTSTDRTFFCSTGMLPLMTIVE